MKQMTPLEWDRQKRLATCERCLERWKNLATVALLAGFAGGMLYQWAVTELTR